MEKKEEVQKKEDGKNILYKMKNIKKDQLLILLLTGVLLAVIAIPVKKKDTYKADGDTVKETSLSNEQMTTDTQILEERLKSLLENVQGVGKTEVMITLKSKGQKVVEKDAPTVDNDSQEADSAGGTRSTKELTKNEATVYQKDGNGNEMPYVVEELEPKIEGVVIIAQGGDNPIVVQNISEAVAALFHVAANKIKVMKMN